MTWFKENIDFFLEWMNAEVTKIGSFFTKVVQKLKLSENVKSKICSPNPAFLNKNQDNFLDGKMIIKISI